MKKINKYYEKALKLYSTGNIDKAIEMLDKGIGNDLSNSNLLNLKGLLLYMKGDLDKAKVIWNINRYYNDDKIAVSYLKDISDDYEKIEFYKKVELLIENLNIDEALNLLKVCNESDFNYINVNSLMALCYFKKGDYTESQNYINKVLEIDKNNDKAIGIKKEIEEFTGKKQINKLSLALISIILIVLSVFLKYELTDKNLKDKEAFNNIEVQENSENDANNNEIVENIKEDKEENKEKEEVKESNEEEKKEESQNVEIKYLTDEEIINNYQEASDYYDKENYTRTRDILKDTIIASKENYLKDDSIFLLAATYEMLSDNDNAIKEYEVYVNSYKDGAYIQEAYYKLSLLYKSKDLNKSKEYANIIRNNYSDSIYNNNVIKEIIGS